MPKLLRPRPACLVLTGTLLASIACTGGKATEPVNAPLDPDAGVGTSDAAQPDGGPTDREPGDGETGDAWILAADGGLPTIPEAGETVVYDLAHYGNRGSGTALELANDTLVFPLSSTPGTRAPSAVMPGDLLVLYTRVGCWGNPDEWIGAGALPRGSARRLLRVTIDQPSKDLANQTCLSYRTNAGRWQPMLKPATIHDVGRVSRAEFVLDEVFADAAAIFLPAYTNVSRLGYSLGTD